VLIGQQTPPQGSGYDRVEKLRVTTWANSRSLFCLNVLCSKLG
jgi:hypothetical protein